MVKKLYTREKVRAIDQLVIANGLPGYDLMQRAASAAFTTLKNEWPTAQKILIFCGLGNNAGDGYVLARLLKHAGYNVTLLQIGSAAKFKGEALQAYNDALAAGIQPLNWDNTFTYQSDVIVDALFGTGLNSPLQGDFFAAVNYINTQSPPVLAIDIPSGLDANSGEPLGIAVKADVTVTFIAYKIGLFQDGAAAYCGKVVFADLGLSSSDYMEIQPDAIYD